MANHTGKETSAPGRARRTPDRRWAVSQSHATDATRIAKPLSDIPA